MSSKRVLGGGFRKTENVSCKKAKPLDATLCYLQRGVRMSVLLRKAGRRRAHLEEPILGIGQLCWICRLPSLRA